MEKKYELHNNGYTANIIIDDINKFVKIGQQDDFITLKKDDWNNLIDLVETGKVRRFV